MNLLQDAEDAFRTKNYLQALYLFQCSYLMDDGHSSSIMLLIQRRIALIYYIYNDLASAEIWTQYSISYAGRFVPHAVPLLQYMLGILYQRRGNLQRAVPIFKLVEQQSLSSLQGGS